ncbi:mRNA-binding ribosome biosynthesis protein NOP4 [Ascoidea rubescens DSM 1968]|uniref:Putative nucleolar protein Nop4 n=1 Tax=Ascoidea rubescens DSM 1968 TaxID=1344418 RepID=A0A1D2VC86_9ASCO|nr:putative nucleolar protein Nop4 [Ascoidea rubescens DSM 1968]ODV59334.1 putative nucleolar protein Nop4 [Ascoidea rubescens DSM 1968]
MDPPKTKSKTSNDADQKTLFVRAIPYTTTGEQLTDFFSNFAPVKHSAIVTDAGNNSKGFGFVTFPTNEDCKIALDSCKLHKYNDKLLLAEYAKKRQRKPMLKSNNKDKHLNENITTKNHDNHDDTHNKKRNPRLIIRNLPWKVKKPKLILKYFQRFGSVLNSIIPRGENSRMSGFAIITMKKQKAAKAAVDYYSKNPLKIFDREVAIDFAISKDKWIEYRKTLQDKSVSNNGKNSKTVEKHINDSKDESGNSAKESDDDNDDKTLDEKSDYESDEEDSVTDEEKLSNNHPQNGTGIGSNNQDEENQFEKRPPKNTVEPYLIFVKNLPYDATSKSLTEHFEQFGKIKYALPVIDKKSGLAKGTGFISFYEKESFDNCLNNAPDANHISMLISDDVPPLYVFEGRILSIASAVSKERASVLTEQNSKKRLENLGKLPDEKDKRNLFLLNEGRITENSKVFKLGLISKKDMSIREQSYNLRIFQLNKNSSLHLSLTRLAVRNIPRSLTEKGLKALGRKAIVEFAKEVKGNKRQPLSKEELTRSTRFKQINEIPNDNTTENSALKKKKTKNTGVIKQAKIMIEIKDGGKEGRSRGYGFLEFRDHKHALMGLRWLNAHEVTEEEILEGLDEEGTQSFEYNSQNKRRLVVEFAVENSLVAKRRREAKTKQLYLGKNSSNNRNEYSTGQHGSRKYENVTRSIYNSQKRKRNDNEIEKIDSNGNHSNFKRKRLGKQNNKSGNFKKSQVAQ